MRDVMLELKALRLHGIVGALGDLVEQGGDDGLENARWLVQHLLQAEAVDRGMRSVEHQMHAAKFPVHRDLAGFDFDASPVDRKLVMKLADMDFTEQMQNVVLVGGCGTGKSHLATALGVAGVAQPGKRVRFYSTVDLVITKETIIAINRAVEFRLLTKFGQTGVVNQGQDLAPGGRNRRRHI